MKFHPLLISKTYNSFKELEKKIEILPTTKERGDCFEDFIYCYLFLKKQKYQITKVYRLKDAPKELLFRYKIEKNDSGVDGLFKTIDGSTAGYQVKFRSNRQKPSYSELAKFWVESKNTDYRYTIANCYGITKLAKKQENHIEILVSEFDNLNTDFFISLFELVNNRSFERILFDPYPFQNQIIENVITGFRNNDRGKYIAACGTGKTLTSLWISEELVSKEIIFLAPSLSLIKQTLEEWAGQTKEPFMYLCVCSDKTVSQDIEDLGDIAITDFDIPVTTKYEDITDFLSQETKYKRIIFSTYQSLEVVAKAMESISEYCFDLAIFDEAHRTAGVKYSKAFNLGLSDEYIKCKKRLFMTATERMLMPRLKERAKKEDRLVFSMDDENIYGKAFHKLNFGEAINLDIVSDYRIVVAAVKEKEIYDWIVSNTELKDDNEELNAFAQVVFTQILLSKTLKNYELTKTISFHSSIINSKIFTSGLYSDYDLKSIIEMFNSDIPLDSLYINHIDGSYTAGVRREIMDEFKEAKFGVLSNSRCLTEGVDVPEIDSIYFVDPKNSLIDIVQACGRSLRKSKGKGNKIAHIIIPILIPEEMDEEALFNSDKFETVYNVVQSLRDQDNRLEQWINLLNRDVSKGRYTKPEWTPLDIELPKGFDINKFEKNLFTRIAIINCEPTSKKFRQRKIYGKKDRISSHSRLFRTIGDYSFESFKNNLIFPTLEKFSEVDEILAYKKLKINHNNVSHTFRLGLIEKLKHKNYKLTAIGKQVKNKDMNFTNVFRSQMLKYFIIDKNNKSRILFPYRTFLKVILNVKKINFLHFAYPLCTLYDSSEKSLLEVIEGIQLINEEIPSPDTLNEANQRELQSDLNSLWNLNYTYTDVWTKNTTLYNQWIYFRNHLSLFENYISWDEETGRMIMINGRENELLRILNENSELEDETNLEKLILKYTDIISVFLISISGN